MLACENCGHVFDEDDAVHETEYTGVTSEAWSEKFDVTKCPECGDDWIIEGCGGCAAYLIHYMLASRRWRV